MSKDEIEALRQKISAWVTKNPEKAAIILSAWLNQAIPSVKNKKTLPHS